MRRISPAEKALNRERPLIIGHRGAAHDAPENTLPSFQLALDAGADLVEFDYHHSKDGVPMAIHDRFLDRTTDARKKFRRRRIKISTKTAAEIQTLDAGSWFEKKFSGAKVPALAEALDLICGKGGVAVIEHKSGDPGTLVDLLRRLRAINKVVLISFDWKFLREFHELEPRQILGALGPPARLTNGRRPVHLRRRMASRLKEIARTGASVAVWNRRLSKRDIAHAHARELKVWIYTVNDLKLARRLLKRGVDGIISDRPAALRQAMAPRE